MICGDFILYSMQVSVFAFLVPLDDVSEPPGILVKLELQLAFLVDDELRGREKNTVTLVLVLIVIVYVGSADRSGTGKNYSPSSEFANSLRRAYKTPLEIKTKNGRRLH